MSAIKLMKHERNIQKIAFANRTPIQNAIVAFADFIAELENEEDIFIQKLDLDNGMIVIVAKGNPKVLSGLLLQLCILLNCKGMIIGDAIKLALSQPLYELASNRKDATTSISYIPTIVEDEVKEKEPVKEGDLAPVGEKEEDDDNW